MIATLENNLIKVAFKYNPRLVGLVKYLPQATYDGNVKAWYLPLNHYAVTSIKTLADHGFQIDPEISSRLIEETRKADEILAIREQDEGEFETTLPLMPFQKVGASFLQKSGNGILAFDIGLGKSITSLAVAQAEGGKVLIVCPKILCEQWRREILKWIPGAKTFIVEGNKVARQKLYKEISLVAECYVIIGYELMRIDIDSLQKI